MIYFKTSEGDYMVNIVQDYDDTIEHLRTVLDQLDVGTKVVIEVVEMTEEEFYALDEY